MPHHGLRRTEPPSETVLKPVIPKGTQPSAVSAQWAESALISAGSAKYSLFSPLNGEAIDCGEPLHSCAMQGPESPMNKKAMETESECKNSLQIWAPIGSTSNQFDVCAFLNLTKLKK